MYRVGLPRADLAVNLDGVQLKPGFALGSYAAFEALPGKTLVVGDLCLLEREIEPVMTQLRQDGNCQGVWCQKFWKSCHCLGLQDLGLVACRSGSGGCQGFEERTLMRFI